MITSKSLISPTQETFEDELDAHVADSMKDPEFRAASADFDRRVGLIETLVKLRKEVGLTQAQLARRMGVGQSTVSGFETEGSDPRLSTVQRYARAVEAECHVVIQVSMSCDWIAPAHVYMESVESGPNVHVDRSAPSDKAIAWANRKNFALAS